MPVAIGDLRERVQLQQEIRARDDVGGFDSTWSAIATVWARVAPASVGERFMRQQMQASAGWKVTIRQRSDLSLSPKLRVVWSGRTFEVRGMTNADERRRFIELACDELSVQGLGTVSTAGQPIGLLLLLTKAT